MIEVKINSEFIKLDQFLKYVNVVQSGGHAKIVIKEGLVKVNNEIVYERGKKLYNDFIIEFDSNKFIIKKEE